MAIRRGPKRVFAGDELNTQAVLVEVLLSGFFAVACFRSRAETVDEAGITPRALFVFIDRLERLRRSRWQWFAMGLLLVLVRIQQGTPLVAELTALVQFIVFLALPTHKPSLGVISKR